MFSVGGLLGSLLYGIVCDRIGRKWALRTVAVPQIISYFLKGFATNSFTILLSRVFAGFSGGALYICIPLFVSEISEDMFVLLSFHLLTFLINFCHLKGFEEV